MEVDTNSNKLRRREKKKPNFKKKIKKQQRKEKDSKAGTNRYQNRQSKSRTKVKRKAEKTKSLPSSSTQDPISADSQIPTNEEQKTEVHLLEPDKAKTKVAKKRLEKKKNRFIERANRATRAEILNTVKEGFIVPDDGVPTYFVRQKEICDAVDVASATKHFELDLRFGSYRLDYTSNGRFMLLGGKKGHIAAFDWMTKDLMTEMNVMESIRDVQWLHLETMFAVAQKRWLRIYDRAGTELHCIKGMYDIRRLEFLPKHFLLVGSSGNTFLTWLDISIGKEVASFPTGHGSLDVLTQNPTNAIIVSGDSRGTVSMWSPNSKKPLVEMLTHQGPVLGISIDPIGNLMATTGLDNRMRIWDLRNYKEMHSYAGQHIQFGPLAFSQRHCLAVASGEMIQIYNDAHIGHATKPYLMYRCDGLVTDVQFCPYEDVLGVGHTKGLVSLLVPGSGQSNYDALRENPFESKKQRQEREVRMLLDKLQPELITMNPKDINRVNRKGLRATMEYKRDVMNIKPEEIADSTAD